MVAEGNLYPPTFVIPPPLTSSGVALPPGAILAKLVCTPPSTHILRGCTTTKGHTSEASMAQGLLSHRGCTPPLTHILRGCTGLKYVSVCGDVSLTSVASHSGPRYNDCGRIPGSQR